MDYLDYHHLDDVDTYVDEADIREEILDGYRDDVADVAEFDFYEVAEEMAKNQNPTYAAVGTAYLVAGSTDAREIRKGLYGMFVRFYHSHM